MSTYSDIRDRAKSLLQGAARFSGNTGRVSTRFAVLDSGTPEAVVMTPGGFTPEVEAGLMNYRSWDILLNVFVRVAGDEDDALATFEDLRGAVIDLFAQYPTLNHLAGVTEQTLGSEGDPDFIYDKSNTGPLFIVQVLRLTVTHRADLSGGEF